MDEINASDHQEEERKMGFSIEGVETNVAAAAAVFDLKPPIAQGRVISPVQRSSKGKWTKEEDETLHDAVKKYNSKNWKAIAACLPNRTDVQCLHRWQKVLDPDLHKGPWSKEEDNLIIELAGKQGNKKWTEIAKQIPGRIGKQCRERWENHLKPNITKVPWTKEEEIILLDAQASCGNRWAEIAKRLPGRSENSVKNHWNCSLKKKLANYKINRSAFSSSIFALPSLISDKSIIIGYRTDVATDISSSAKNVVSEAIRNLAPQHASTSYLPPSPSHQMDVRFDSLSSMALSPPSCSEARAPSDPCTSPFSRLKIAAMTFENIPSIFIRRRTIPPLQESVSAPDKVNVSLNATDIVGNYKSLSDPVLLPPPKYQKFENSDAIKSVGKCLEQEFKDA